MTCICSQGTYNGNMAKVDFSGKTVLITGASSGIGKALAHEFAKRGAHCVLSALPAEKVLLDRIGATLHNRYRIKTWSVTADLSAPNGPSILYKRVRDLVGIPYCVVNNANTATYGEFIDMPWESQFAIMMVNLYAPMKLMHLFIPEMVKRRDGILLNMSSVVAFQPTPFQSVFGATKAGIQSLSQGLRAELKDSGVTVCTFNPPFMKTEIMRIEGFPRDMRFISLSGVRSPEWAASKALRSLEKRKALHVPGFISRIIHLVLVRFAPRVLIDAAARYLLQGSKRTVRKKK